MIQLEFKFLCHSICNGHSCVRSFGHLGAHKDNDNGYWADIHSDKYKNMKLNTASGYYDYLISKRNYYIDL